MLLGNGVRLGESKNSICRVVPHPHAPPYLRFSRTRTAHGSPSPFPNHIDTSTSALPPTVWRSISP
ncbi:hypothetical protein BD311DRAFT_764480 [Dichomitus squalens]|uniref:Uncharacterized protein n=1 Tax=Dichomitus squalens TaxID=114155 RepID=A0A4Q9MFP3_9APHY|nr:hypothetical protein BD311DRAFT_764480 [Dichomitus squalens]